MTVSDTDARIEIRIPFAGFYCSVHDIALENEMAQINEGSEQIAPDNVAWRAVFLGYSQAYLRALAEGLDLDLAFSRVFAPKFYNFETDAIFAHIRTGEISARHAAIMADPESCAALREAVREKLTPQPGWAPGYSSDLDDWGGVETWTPAQIGFLVDFMFQRSDLDEYQIAEALCERAHDLIWSNIIDRSLVPGHVEGPDSPDM